MIKLGLFLFGFAAFCAAKDVTLTGDKWVWVIQNFSGFNLWRSNETWTINTDENSTIELFCPEVNLGVARWDMARNCANSKLVFDDGVESKTYCSPNFDVVIKGKSSKLKVDFTVEPKSGGSFYCKGKAVPRS